MKDKIIVTPDSILRQKSEEIKKITPEIEEIIAEMRATALDWEKDHPHEMSAAMAAPQLGHLKRVIIVRENNDDKDEKAFLALVNPEVLRVSTKMKKDYEGCLSVPSVYGMVARPDKVTITATLEDGTGVKIKATDGLARTLLHEIDHLDGVLFIDHIRGKKDAFFTLDDKGDLQPLDYSKVENDKTLWG
ncbi:MAG: peptide deformylase [Candidatus Nomurabacteria bacterium]|jgi:peptide deformylase|nr:peptide deformylase [Candidatus Nomurabacteria bacterium]